MREEGNELMDTSFHWEVTKMMALRTLRASMMAQWGKVLAAKLGNLRSNLGTHMAEGEG